MAEKALESLSISTLPSFPLPPLPEILDTEIARKVYTHSSFIARPKGSSQLFECEDEGRDNEKLEHLGDSLLDCAVVGLLQDLYPNLNPGVATLLKSHMVNNETLRQICKSYHLHERLIAPEQALPTLRNGEKVLANLFEAYIAGVYYSYLKHGRSNHTGHPHFQPLSSSSSSSSPSSSSSRTSSPGKAVTRGEAMDNLELWLRPLFTPLAQHILNQMKEEQRQRHSLTVGDIGEDSDTDRKAIGANSKLNQWFTAKEGGIPNYPPHAAGSEGWTVMCEATDRDKQKWYGEATRSTKKAAMAVAAYKVIVQFEKVRPEFKG
ncbi:uncharacterized protein IL334_005864 [Kwoniella shivajii]|uniref:RNase III domain-containing protein n=1 Tax=Kwoniella shivajii TaxID=564305 RepID=A0ABZ1D4N1_9TREE|nr:hypothetical protein IL334_005864 [Kwoniella shivajii]